MAPGADRRLSADAPAALARPGPAVAVLTVAALLAYLVVLHALIADGSRPLLALAVVFVPWIVALLPALLGASSGPARRAAALLVLVASAALAWRFGDALARHADAVLYVENLVFFLTLSGLFALSLRPGRDALITRLARVARGGDMPPPVVHYTRVVTFGWAVFFGAVCAVSTVLFVTQSRTVWSGFVNLAVWPLVGAGFVAEYAIRRRVLRDVKHVSFMTGVMAYRHRDAATRGDPHGGLP